MRAAVYDWAGDATERPPAAVVVPQPPGACDAVV